MTRTRTEAVTVAESEEGFLFDVGPTIVMDNFTEYMKPACSKQILDETLPTCKNSSRF
jgi:hypothetical protein